MIKIIVDRMPEKSKECPFARHVDYDEGNFPAHCLLNLPQASDFWSPSYGGGNYYNCSLDENRPCSLLQPLNKI